MKYIFYYRLESNPDEVRSQIVPSQGNLYASYLAFLAVKGISRTHFLELKVAELSETGIGKPELIIDKGKVIKVF